MAFKKDIEAIFGEPPDVPIDINAAPESAPALEIEPPKRSARSVDRRDIQAADPFAVAGMFAIIQARRKGLPVESLDEVPLKLLRRMTEVAVSGVKPTIE